MRRVLIFGAIVLLAAGEGGYFFYKRAAEVTKAKELELKVSEADRKKVAAEAKKAENARKKAEADKEAKLAAKLAAEADRDGRIHASRAAQAQADAAADEAQAAADRKSAAEADAARTADERAAEEARLAVAAKEAKAAEDARLAEEAKLKLSESARLHVVADTEKTQAAIRLEELKKQRYDALVAENEALREILRQREEETRPEKTLKDLIDQNERARAEELGEAAETEAEGDAPPPKKTPGMKNAPAIVKTAADKGIDTAGELAEANVEKMREGVRIKAVRELGEALHNAIRMGDRDAAEYYLQNILLFVPDYNPL